jgi:hypothetical protein
MQITEITQHTYEIIETDTGDYPIWRRNSNGEWENLMGMSWEEVDPPEELLRAYEEGNGKGVS